MTDREHELADHERAIQQCEDLLEWIDGERAMAHARRNRWLARVPDSISWFLKGLPPAMFVERYWIGLLSGFVVGLFFGGAYVW